MPFSSDFKKIEKLPSRHRYFREFVQTFPFHQYAAIDKETGLPVVVSVYFLDRDETFEDAKECCKAVARPGLNHPSLCRLLKTIFNVKDGVVYTVCEDFRSDLSFATLKPQFGSPTYFEDCMVVLKHLLELSNYLEKKSLALGDLFLNNSPDNFYHVTRNEKNNKIESVVFRRELTTNKHSRCFCKNTAIDLPFVNLAAFAYHLFFGQQLATTLFTWKDVDGRYGYHLNPPLELFEYDDDEMIFVKTLLYEKSFNFEAVMQTQLMKKAGFQLDFGRDEIERDQIETAPLPKEEKTFVSNPASLSAFTALSRNNPNLLMTFECGGGETFKAITSLMSVLSPVVDTAMKTKSEFYNPFTNTFQIFGFDPKNIQKMIEFCESSSIQETAGSEMELLEIASFFKIEILEEYAANLCIEAVTNVNIIEMFQLARKLKNAKLEKYCIQRGVENPALFMAANVTNVSPECVSELIMLLQKNKI